MSEHRLPDPPREEDFRTIREFIEAAQEYNEQTGEWPPDPLLDEVADMRRQIMADHGNDWRKVVRWHVEQDKLFREENPDARIAKKRSTSASASGR